MCSLTLSFIILIQYNKNSCFKLKPKELSGTKQTNSTDQKARKKYQQEDFQKPPSEKQVNHSIMKVDNDDMFNSSLLSDETRPSQIQMTSFDQPSWMISYRQCTALIKEVQFLEQQISKQKLKKLSSISQKKHDLIIKQFTEQASDKLTKCQKKLKQMQYNGNFDTQSSHIDKKTFTNMLIAMAANIRDHARTLRNQQQSELYRERQLNNFTKNSVHDDIARMKQTQNWLIQDEFQMMEQDDLQERDVQITKILKSIYSLNTLYKQLQNFVIQQGSLLDRIDSNIDSAVVNVAKAKEHLESASKKQQSSCFMRLALTLMGLIFLMLILFFIKHS